MTNSMFKSERDWKIERIDHIIACMRQNTRDRLKIPEEWFTELEDLLAYVIKD